MSVLKISDAASLALHTMCLLGAQPDALLTTHEIAGRLGVSEAHLAKVLQRLGRAGLIESTRGPGGGFRLARSPEEISLLETYEAIDGPIGEPSCLLGKPACAGHCVLGELLCHVHETVRSHLASQRVSTLAGAFSSRKKARAKGSGS